MNSEKQVFFDRAGSRPDGCGGRRVYEFRTVEQFADAESLSPRQVRYLIAEQGMPHHGRPHKGLGGLFLCDSASRWLEKVYRPETIRGRKFRLGACWRDASFEAEDIFYRWEDEKMAFGILYEGKFTPDAFVLEEENWEDLASWKKFKLRASQN